MEQTKALQASLVVNDFIIDGVHETQSIMSVTSEPYPGTATQEQYTSVSHARVTNQA